MEAFSGPSRCMTTEKFVGAYQEQTCYANCGDVLQNTSQSSEFEVILNGSTDQLSYQLIDKATFWRNHYIDNDIKP